MDDSLVLHCVIPYLGIYHSISQITEKFGMFIISGRVDNVYGDRNLICTLLTPSQMVEEQAAATA